MIRKVLLAVAATLPLACLLDLPSPEVTDGSFLPDGSAVDTGLPDGSSPDGPGPDGGTDGSVLDAGGCDGGACIFYTMGNLDPHMLDTDGMSLFFADGSYTADSLSLQGKVLTQLLNGMDFINDLRVRSGSVFLAVTMFSGKFNVFQCPSNKACMGSRVDFIANGMTKATHVADSDGTKVYFTIEDTGVNGGGVVRCDVGAQCASLAPFKTTDVPINIAVSASTLFWSDNLKHGVFTCGLPTCAGSGMQAGNSIIDFTTLGTTTFWVEGGGNVWRQQGNNAVPIAAGQMNAVKIRADASYVYWIRDPGGGQGALYRCGVGADCMNSSPTPLLSGMNQPSSLAITNDSVYIAARGDHAIWRWVKQ